MLIIVPWRTDAPVYHRPWATLGLIVANILVYALLGTPEPRTFFGEQAPANAWVLRFDEIGPLTWLTHFFVHGGLVHLLGNMIFLWTFGLVVEGAGGPKALLGIYLPVGLLTGAVAQIAFQGSETVGAYGASAAVTGLMLVALVWAPANHVTAWVLVFVFALGNIDFRISRFCYVMILWDGVFWWVAGFRMSGMAAHLIGAVLGFGIGSIIVRMGWVDTEDEDLYSLRRKRREFQEKIHQAAAEREAHEAADEA